MALFAFRGVKCNGCTFYDSIIQSPGTRETVCDILEVEMGTGINRIIKERRIAAGPSIPGVRALAGIAFLLIAAGVIFGCSTAVQDSPLSLLDVNGNHPAGWIQAHGSYAAPAGELCKSCHGENLDGGISAISCSSSSYKGQSCHVGGPGFHPADWLNKAAAGTSVFHGTASQYFGLPACAICHEPPVLNNPAGGKCYICHFGTSGALSPGGWTHPTIPTDPVVVHGQFKGTSDEAVCVNCHDTNNQFGNMPTPLCHNCHNPYSVPFLDHNQVVPLWADFDGNCSACHSVDGSVTLTGPACITCHTGGSPYTYANCSSCHANPPDGGGPVGSNFPNLKGEHNKHKDFTSCSDCHTGGGSGAGLKHGYNDTVNLQAPSGITFYPGSGNVTCAGTCHGEGHSNSGNRWY